MAPHPRPGDGRRDVPLRLGPPPRVFGELIGTSEQRRAAPELEWTPGLRRFVGTHPRVATEWIAARRREAGGDGSGVGPRRLRLSDLRYYVSDWVERLTGVRPFEYRNYVLV